MKHDLEPALGVECAWPRAPQPRVAARLSGTWRERMTARFAAAWPRIAQWRNRGSERGKRS